MPKILKYSFITIIGLVVLLLVIPFFIPLNSYKGMIINKVQEATGRDLTINGDIKLALLPNPAISLHEVNLSSIVGHTDAPSLISIKEAKAALSLFSLLSGNIEVVSLELEEPIINLEILAEGQKNWEFSSAIPKCSVSKDQVEVSNNKTFELPILINAIKIANGKLIYIENNQQKIFEDINLEVNTKTIKGPIDFTFVVNATGVLGEVGRKINIAGNIAEIATIMPIEVIFDIAGEKIKIDGKFDSENNSFTGNIASKGNTKNLAKNFDISQELQSEYELISSIIADNKQVIIKDARLTYGNVGLLANGSYDLNNNSIKSDMVVNPGNMTMNISSNADKSSVLNANIKLQAQLPEEFLAALNFKVNKLPVTNQKFTLDTNIIYKPEEIILKNIEFISGNSNMQGEIKLKNFQQDAAILYNLKINKLESFMTLFGITTSHPVGQMQFNGDLQKVQDDFHINSKILTLGTNLLIKGSVNLLGTKSGSRPSFNLAISSPLVNLNKLMAKNSGSSQSGARGRNNVQGAGAIAGAPWPNTPIDVSFLNSIEGAASISIDKLTDDSLVLDNLKAKLTIAGGKLDIPTITANIYGGKLNANGYFNASHDQKFAARIDLKNAYLKNITPQGGKIKVTKGQLNLKADFNSSGKSIYNYINNLNGQFNVNSANGKISGFDLNRIVYTINNVRNIEGILKAINSSFNAGETSFNNLVVNGNIAKGVATLTECHLDAAPAMAHATGQINLPLYTMDINSSVNIDNFPPLGVKLYGSINNPQHKLDIKALQTYLVKNVLNSVVKDLKGGEKKPENIIKDALGLRKRKNDDTGQENNNKASDPVNKLLQKSLKKLF